jgi:tetratricopeptide (TPR) repeat protein
MKIFNKLASVVLVLAFSALTYGQTTQAQPPAQQPAQPAQPGQQPAQPAHPGQAQPGGQPAQPGQPQQKKEIKDPAEYNAYVSGAGQSDPASKASAMESFLTQYPNSVVKEEALEALMSAYQQMNNPAKMSEAANKLLQVNPSSIKALLVMALQKRGEAETGGPNSMAAAQQARQYGETGLKAIETYVKPEGMSDADYQKLRSTAMLVFNGAAARGALQAKDYAAAQKYFGASVQADPNNLNDAFPLAVAYLEPRPPVQVGFWYAARAAGLAAAMVQKGQLPPAAQQQITNYGRIKYKNFHGGEDGWPELIAQAQASPNPPAGFAVKPAPTPAEQCSALASSKDPRKMDFGEWELVFTYCDPATQDRVWNAIKGVNLQFVAQVIQVSKTKLTLAATADAIQAGKADVDVTMAVPIPAARMPKVGSQITVAAVPLSYDKQPYMMHMGQGKLAVARKAAAPPARRKRR